MELSHLAASDFDQIKLAAFIAAFLINRQALVIVAFHLIGEAIFNSVDSGFYTCIFLAALYSINATVNIKLSCRIRQALICIGAINWLAALDYFVSPSETVFYLCYPWLVNGLDVFILYLLLHTGGRQSVGIVRPFNCRMVNL